MLNNKGISLDRLIAKIDNDFNPNNSDWIPRVGAWCIDALGMIGATRTKTIEKEYNVYNRIARIDEHLVAGNFDVYNCCHKRLDEGKQNCCAKCCKRTQCPSTGAQLQDITPDTVSALFNNQANEAPNIVAQQINTKNYPYRYNYYPVGACAKVYNYILVDPHTIELSYDECKIYIVTEGIETSKDNSYGVELPVIPDNAYILEALTYYCMYKMLCRGYQHPVFNLAASQYGTNPYYMWMQLKDKARTSYINQSQGNIDAGTDLFKSAFYITTFDPRKEN